MEDLRVKFTYVVMLRKSPWYVYASDRDDAIKVCERYKELVTGVVCSDSSLSVFQLKSTLILESQSVPLIGESNVQILEDLSDEAE